jgi:hypothetical protein
VPLEVSKGTLDRRRCCECGSFAACPLHQPIKHGAREHLAHRAIDDAGGVHGATMSVVQIRDEADADERAFAIETESFEEVGG